MALVKDASFENKALSRGLREGCYPSTGLDARATRVL